MRNLSYLLALSLVFLFSTNLYAQKKSCEYEIKDVKPGWTAYKFTEKAPVSGTFNKFTVSSSQKGKDISSAIKGLSVDIDGSSVESGNVGRNATVAMQFFAKFAPVNKMAAKAIGVNGDDKKGSVTILVDMNKKQKNVDFKYTVNAEGKLSAEAVIDMMDFALKGPFDSIHKACKLLHTGKDGISKTWTEVLLKVSANLVKTCK